MRPFAYARAASARDATEAAQARGATRADAHVRAPVQYLAGGTNLIDLMKIDVMRPVSLVDILDLRETHGAITVDDDALHLGALVHMAEAADHPEVRRGWPALHDALALAASAQLRQMATLGGNVLQRTRCHYFRDTSWPCAKREPGQACSAIGGVTRQHAVLGTSEQCIAAYPGDFGVVLAAFDTQVHTLRAGGARTLAFEALHRLPAHAPHVETTLEPGELITGFTVPAAPWARRSCYVKVRDRTSYDFALASAAVGLELAPDGSVQDVRIGVGGVATRPWRSRPAEDALRGRPLDESAARGAAEAAFAGAVVHGGNAFKPELGRRTLVRALLQAQAMGT